MIISERIFKILKDKNMTQMEFAKRAGFSNSAISDWKRKKTNPSAEKIMDICYALEVKMENDTVWLTQAQLVELYQSSKANVSEHIAHIFEEGELVKEAVVRKFRTTASDGKRSYKNLVN